MNKIAIYPGSFDPITLGHLDIVKRSLNLVDKLIIAIGKNTTKVSSTLFSIEERLDILHNVVSNEIDKAFYNKIVIKSFNGLLVDFAKKENANIIIRGIRALSDFDFEFNLAGINYKINPNIETVFLIASESNQFISSKFVKEIAKFKGDTSKLVPKLVAKKLKEKLDSCN